MSGAFGGCAELVSDCRFRAHNMTFCESSSLASLWLRAVVVGGVRFDGCAALQTAGRAEELTLCDALSRNMFGDLPPGICSETSNLLKTENAATVLSRQFFSVFF